MISISVDDFASWRDQARRLLATNTAPSKVHWTNSHTPSLFATPTIPSPASDPVVIRVPRNFITLAQQAASFVDHDQPARKWALLYSLLWRVTHENRAVMSLQSDAEVAAVRQMVKSVSRDRHKMEAFLRFQRCGDASVELYTAWFEPEHAIIELEAPFFAKRFAGMHWTIATPHGCAHWDRKTLKLSPGISRPDLKNDDFELFWRTYYTSIFNPARLKEKAMMAEMPKKYWRYLPEATTIKSLTRGAAATMDRMLSRPATSSDRVRRKSQSLRQQQDGLRLVNRD